MSGVDRGQDGVIRRKVNAVRGEILEGGPGADRGWRLALARAARDQLKAALDVKSMMLSRVSLAEVLELPPSLSLLAVLEGPGEGLGMLAIAPDLFPAMIEVLTIGRTQGAVAAPRKPTRTDAAMLAPMIDAALIDLEVGLAEEADLIWAGGWRYASFLDDPRPLGLMLEDISYRLLTAEVDLGHGARRGRLMLALPAEGRGQAPKRHSGPASGDAVALGRAFADALADEVSQAEARLEAVLTRLCLPLSRVIGLAVGDVLPLSAAALDRISLEGVDGRQMAEGKLGQSRGLRAVRLCAGVAPKARVRHDPDLTHIVAPQPTSSTFSAPQPPNPTEPPLTFRQSA
ncbi:FliM/FliN family flagellar motor switch protein [Tabrizicola sp.]|uniref:FliM/FliN family flagellar motor switch protein n=1 Tax=Tabrizicola sp. TaxID=2005166 RepID=UPI003D2D7CF1